MKKLIGILLLIATLYFFEVSLKQHVENFVTDKPTQEKNDNKKTIIKGVSGTEYELELPEGWQVEEDLKDFSEDTEFFLMNAAQDQYIGCSVMNRSDFEGLSEYAAWIEKNLYEYYEIDAVFSEVSEGENRIMSSEYIGIFDGVKLRHLSYLFANSKHYVELSAWTVNSNFDSSKLEFTSILNSFIELDGSI